MIYEVEGDIMMSRAQAIVHGVAVNDSMIRGFAHKVQQQFPTLVADYKAWCEEASPEPGEIWLWSEPGSQQVINLVIHDADDDPTRMRRPDRIALNRSFRALNRLVLDERIKSLAMPMVGSGEFGLDWHEVKGMMDAQLGNLLIPIFVYTEHLEGQVAFEPGM